MSWFGWSSGGSSPSRPPAKPSKAARDALPGLDFDPDAPVHFDDGDLEDPELLVGALAQKTRQARSDARNHAGNYASSLYRPSLARFLEENGIQTTRTWQI